MHYIYICIAPSTMSQGASSVQSGILPYKRSRISGILPYNTLVPQRCKLCHELTAAFMVADRLPVSRKFTAGLIRFLSILSLYCSSRDEVRQQNALERQTHVHMQQGEEHVPCYTITETKQSVQLCASGLLCRVQR